MLETNLYPATTFYEQTGYDRTHRHLHILLMELVLQKDIVMVTF